VEIAISDSEPEGYEPKGLVMTEPVIKLEHLTYVKIPIFTDTKTLLEKGKNFPKWLDMYKNFQNEEFPEIVPLNDLEKMKYDDLVCIHIKEYYLHFVGASRQYYLAQRQLYGSFNTQMCRAEWSRTILTTL